MAAGRWAVVPGRLGISCLRVVLGRVLVRFVPRNVRFLVASCTPCLGSNPHGPSAQTLDAEEEEEEGTSDPGTPSGDPEDSDELPEVTLLP